MEVIEGRNPVIEALKAGRPISKILINRSAQSRGAIDQILYLCRLKGIVVEYVDRQKIEERSRTGASQGVIALAVGRTYADLSSLLAVAKSRRENPLLVVLDGIEDPHNLGAILRTAEATGVHGVVIRERRAVGLTPAVVKASAGAAEYISIARVANISQTVLALKKEGIWVTGIDMDSDVQYDRVDFKLPSAIVIGGEGRGLSELVRKRCDTIASIPMIGRVASLNASVAAAVVMYEVLRQRVG